MKKGKIVILILFIFINSFSLVSCKVFSKLLYGLDIEITNKKKWIKFKTDLKEIVDNYYSVENEVTINIFKDACQKKEFPDDTCFEDLDAEEQTENYWNDEEKIKNYKIWQNKVKELPILENNPYENDINKLFKNIRLWILYKHFWNQKKFERKFTEIFEISFSLNNLYPRMIKTKNVALNNLFNINWEYEIEVKNPKDSKKMIKKYNSKTQEKIFEFITYHKYIESEFDKVLEINIENYPNIDKGRHFKKITDYKDYIDENYYNQWKNKEKNKIENIFLSN